MTRTSSLYCAAAFARGTGLGNRLFPWGRAVLWSLDHDAVMLRPAWNWPPRIRSLAASRSIEPYRQLLLSRPFRPRPGELYGPGRRLVQWTAEPYAEENAAAALARARTGAAALVVFRGDRGQFRELGVRHEELRAALRDSLAPRWRAVVDAAAGTDVGIHVRRGDFKEATDPSDFLLRGAIRSPLSWFEATLDALGRAIGRTPSTLVVSDAPAAELAPLLARPGVRRLARSSPVTDLLALAGTRLVIGSGGSSFSAWGAFLAGAPVVTVPGQSLAWFGLGTAGPSVPTTYDPAAPDPTLPQVLLEALG